MLGMAARTRTNGRKSGNRISLSPSASTTRISSVHLVMAFAFGCLFTVAIIQVRENSISALPRGEILSVLATTEDLSSPAESKEDTIATTTTPPVLATPPSSLSSGGSERNFFEIAKRHMTDKVAAHTTLPACLQKGDCTRPGCKNARCSAWGHFYDTAYQTLVAPIYSRDDSEPFQFLEIGFFNGHGYDAYREFLPRGECHSMEISCLPQGPQNEGKWPWGNFASKNRNYQKYLDEERLHCGDATNLDFLNEIWMTKMKRPDAPPLKIVVDDGAHVATHMAQSVFFWFPRIEPGGLMIVEDVQPIDEANLFRTDFLPQMMTDLHYCGDPKEPEDEPCFPTLQRLLKGIHCEMHICVFQRNEEPSVELSLEDSKLPEGALDRDSCHTFQNRWGKRGWVA